MTISVQSWPPFQFLTKEERKQLLDNLKSHIAIADDLSADVLYYLHKSSIYGINNPDMLIYTDIKNNIDYSKERFDMMFELDNSYFQNYCYKNEFETNLFCKPTKKYFRCKKDFDKIFKLMTVEERVNNYKEYILRSPHWSLDAPAIRSP